MKKTMLSLILITVVILTGCSSPEPNAPAEPVVETPIAEAPTNEPDGETQDNPVKPPAPDGPVVSAEASKTLTFYTKLFSSNEFTLSQHVSFQVGEVETRSSTTTVRDGKNYAMLSQWQSGSEQASGFRIIIRDGLVYSVDDGTRTYWVTDDSSQDNIAEQTGQVINQLEGLEYVVGQAEVDGVTYDTETYVDQGLLMTYFFVGDELKFMETRSNDTSTRIYIDVAQQTADPDMFLIPDDYVEVDGASEGGPVG